MSVKIRDIRVICTAPEGINLVVVKIETNQPGLYGLGCATFAYRHLTVKHLIEEYMKPLLVGRPVENYRGDLAADASERLLEKWPDRE